MNNNQYTYNQLPMRKMVMNGVVIGSGMNRIGCKMKKKIIFKSIYLCIWIFFVPLHPNLLCTYVYMCMRKVKERNESCIISRWIWVADK